MIKQLIECMFGVFFMKRYVIVNRRRFTIFMTVFMTFVFMFIFSIGAMINKVEGYAFPTYKEVIVSEGDTIWSIAKVHKSSNEDIRKVIHDIGSLNDLDDYQIHPGQIIKISTEEY